MMAANYDMLDSKPTHYTRIPVLIVPIPKDRVASEYLYSVRQCLGTH